MSEELKTGRIVYVYEHWSGQIIEATLGAHCESGYEIEYHFFVDRNGKHRDSFYGSSVRALKDIWLTVEEAYAAIDAKKDVIINKYLSEVNTVQDLVTFPLNHCFSGNEYTDYEAIKAYKIKVKELLGIEL